MIVWMSILSFASSGLLTANTVWAKEAKTGEVLQGDYVAIVNTNADPSKKQNTGAIEFDANGGTVKGKPLSEEVSAFHEESIDLEQDTINKQKKKERKRAVTTYQVGDQRKFYKGKNYICIGVGKECYIWMEEIMHQGYVAAGKVEKAAKEMQFVYEGEPFQMLKDICNDTMYYADNSGKLSILLEDTGNSSGFYAGEADITAIHIKAPEANRYSGGQFAGKNGLLVHEGQHAVFRDHSCNHDASIAHKFSWLNEGMAVAAMDYTWGGGDPNGWMSFISENTELRNGAPLVYSSYRGAAGLDYGIQYAFVRYLSNQLAGGTYQPIPFLNAVYKTEGKDKSAKEFVDAIIKNYDSKSKLTFEDALTNFYVAMVAFEPTGMKGFGNDGIPASKIGSYPIYMGESGRSTELAGTGAIIVKTNNKTFTVPKNAGADIRFVAFDKADKSVPPKGNGTAENPYVLNQPEDISFLSVYSGANFQLGKDIDMSQNTQVYITPEQFSGVLDGKGHQITNLTTPLIGDNQGTIQNLTVQADLTDEYLGDVGFLVEQNKGRIQGCTATGTIRARLIGGNMVLPNNFGAIAGFTRTNSSIRECHGDVTAQLELSTNHARIGGLVGENEGAVYDSYATGAITVRQPNTDRSLYVGGAIGSLKCRTIPAPYIHNLYSTTSVNVESTSADQAVGTLFGNVKGNVVPTIESSYGPDTPVVTGNGDQTLNQVCGKIEADMEKKDTYVDWKFDSIWKMPTKGTPVFTTNDDIGNIKPNIGRKECYVGEKLDLYGSTLTVNGTNITLLEDMITSFDSSVPGTTTAKGIYKEKEFTFPITVKEPHTITDLTIYKGAKDSYVEGELFQGNGVVLKGTLDGNQHRYIYSGFTNDKPNALQSGDSQVTYDYCGANIAQNITVAGKQISSLRLIQPPKKLVYAEGEQIDLDGLVLQVQYNDGTYSNTFTMKDSASYQLQWSNGEGTAVDITKPLVFADNQMTLVATCQVNPQATIAVAALEVISAMKIDDTVFYVPHMPDKVSESEEYWPAIYPAVSGGSGNYQTQLKAGYEQKVKDAGMIINSKPGENGSEQFTFGFQQNKLGTYVIPFIITDVNTQSTAEVNMTVVVQAKSTACELRKVDISEGFGGKSFAGVIEDTTVTFAISKGTDKTALTYHNPIVSPDATINPMNGSQVCNAEGMPKPIVVTAQDGTTKKTYTVRIKEANQDATTLGTATNLLWNGQTATWDVAAGAVGYQIRLQFNEGMDIMSAVTTDTQYDFTQDMMQSGSYKFTVIALGNGTTTLDGQAVRSPAKDYTRNPEVTGIFLEPDFAIIHPGDQKQFTAVVSGVSNPDKTVLWSLKKATSSETSVSSEGLVRIGADETASVVEVIATSIQTPAVFGKAELTLQERPQLAGPVGLTWTWENDAVTEKVIKAQASWSAVTGAVGYRISLLYNGVPVGIPTTGGETVNEQILMGKDNTDYEWKEQITQGGTYQFRVTAIGDGILYDDSKVQVSSEHKYEPPTVTVTGVEVTPNTVTVKQGTTQEFQAKVVGTLNPSQSVTWSVEGADMETTISPAGILTVGNGESHNSLTIRATSNVNSTVSGTAVVTIQAIERLMKPTGLNWDWSTGNVVTKAEASWSPVTDAVGYRIALQKDGEVLGEILELGKDVVSYDFKERITQAGTYLFQVTAMGDGTGHRDSEPEISSNHIYEQKPVVQKVTVSPSEATVAKGAKQQFTATVMGEFEPSEAVTWSIEETTVAEGTGITATGELAVHEEETNTVLTIRATSLADSAIFGQAKVNINHSALPPIDAPTNLIWEGGRASWNSVVDAQAYRVELYYEGVKQGETIQVTEPIYDFTSIITETGNYMFKVIAVGNLTSGVDSIQVESPVYTYVVPAKVTGVTVTSTGSDTMEVGTTQIFMAQVVGTDNPPTTVTWSISGEQDSATVVDSAGKLTVSDMEMAKTIEVTATSTYDQTQSGYRRITIIPKQNPVEQLKTMMAALPKPSDVSAQDTEKIAQAKELYDRLTGKEKEQFSELEKEQLSQIIGALPHVKLEVIEGKELSGQQVKAQKLGLTVTPEEIRGDEQVIVTLEIQIQTETDNTTILNELALAQNMTIGQFYDITLSKRVGTGQKELLTDTEEIGITLMIQESIRGKKTYFVLRAHRQKGEVIQSQVFGNEIAFQSGLFSTYAIAYEKEERKEEAVAPTPPTKPEQQKKPEIMIKSAEAKPKTGDTMNMLPYVAGGLVAALTVCITLFLKKRKK